MTRGEARRFRNKIETAASELSDIRAFSLAELFPHYAVGREYHKGDRLYCGGKLYRVLLDHVSQADWLVYATPSLYTAISDPSIEYPEWRQPAGAHNAYKKGDKVSHGGKMWISQIDANTYEPGVCGWSEVI